MFMQLAGKNVKSSFDFMDGFFQIGLTDDSIGATFFVSRKSGSCIMKFNRSIQGSKNASAVFTRAMQVTFSHLQDIVNFWVYDLIAHSKTVEEHLEHLDTIFARTLDSNLKMSPDKCKFLAGEIKYLGMIVVSRPRALPSHAIYFTIMLTHCNYHSLYPAFCDS